MQSTSTSNRDSENPILEVENLHIAFSADLHRPMSWRDAFIRIAKDPLGAVLAEKERLIVAENLNFKAYRGDRIALLGVNGAGKTSLCRAIAGIYRPSRGRVIRRGKCRSVFDTGIAILPELTGRENALLLAEFMYPDEPDRLALVEDAMEFSELGKFLDVPFRLYSNGMQARLCLSLVSCKPSELMILDEVFDGADSFFREKIAARILNVIQQSGAVLFVSHSPDQVLQSCNRAIVLSQGSIVFDGGIQEGLDYYSKTPSHWSK